MGGSLCCTKYLLHLFLSAGLKETNSPLTFCNGTRGNNQEAFASPPPLPPLDGEAIGSHGDIYSCKVGCNMHNRLSHSCHVKQVILTPSGLKSPGPPKRFPAEWITLFIVVARPLNSRAGTSSAWFWFHRIQNKLICQEVFRRYGWSRSHAMVQTARHNPAMWEVSPAKPPRSLKWNSREGILTVH